MLIIIKMFTVLALMVFLLKRKVPFGHAMLASTILLFLVTNPDIHNLFFAIHKTMIKPDTWFMLITLYFVMCLEHLLRTSGILKDFTASARKLFGSDRVLLGFMPAFLGFLPSLGGAIFSAPLVKEAGQRYQLSPERLTAINYWFRHIWEFTNPILPAILLASQLTKIPVGTLIANQFILTVAAAVIGIAVLLLGKPYRNPLPVGAAVSLAKGAQTTCRQDTNTAEALASSEDQASNQLGHFSAVRSILLAAGPIFLNILLVVVFNMNTALALGLVLAGMALILKLHKDQIKDMFLSSFDYHIQWGVINILLFQQMLDVTGTIDQIVMVFEGTAIPVAAVISITAFVVGLLVGSPQGFVAVSFPLVLPLAQGSLDVVAISYTAGLFGTMTSPAHLCQIVSLQYYKADFFKSLLPIIFMEILLLTFSLVYIYVL